MEVINNEFMHIVFDEDNKILVLTWKPETKNFSDELFKVEFEKWADLIRTHSPKSLMVNATDLLFPPSDEVQKWIADYHTQLAIPKVAMVIGPDIFTQFSIEQSVSQMGGVTTQFFDDATKAKEWLIA